jgi:signal transduction histidine kinase
VIAVLELMSDQPHPRSDLLENLMNDVSAQIGKVIERERSAAEMADLVWREQQGLLHTLHDSLGQTLTGLGMLSVGLAQQVSGVDPSAADTAQLVAQQAQAALDQVRQLSRGIFPVDIDPDAFVASLQSLGSTTQLFHKLDVVVHAESSHGVRDSRSATQLYRIAQEAVTNAVKHANGRSIRIELTGEAGLTMLRVVDDGVGIAPGADSQEGMGLRIMRYRASSIGAVLSVEAGPEGGTTVSCSLRDAPSSAVLLPGVTT